MPEKNLFWGMQHSKEQDPKRAERSLCRPVTILESLSEISMSLVSQVENIFHIILS